MKALKFNNTEVSLNFTTYRSNGTLAVQMNTVPDKDLYGVITVNLGCPLQNDTRAFVDENNLPGIGKWLQKTGVKPTSGQGVTRAHFFQSEITFLKTNISSSILQVPSSSSGMAGPR